MIALLLTIWLAPAVALAVYWIAELARRWAHNRRG